MPTRTGSCRARASTRAIAARARRTARTAGARAARGAVARPGSRRRRRLAARRAVRRCARARGARPSRLRAPRTRPLGGAPRARRARTSAALDRDRVRRRPEDRRQVGAADTAARLGAARRPARQHDPGARARRSARVALRGEAAALPHSGGAAQPLARRVAARDRSRGVDAARAALARPRDRGGPAHRESARGSSHWAARPATTPTAATAW